jgi:hypothetical protein
MFIFSSSLLSPQSSSLLALNFLHHFFVLYFFSPHGWSHYQEDGRLNVFETSGYCVDCPVHWQLPYCCISNTFCILWLSHPLTVALSCISNIFWILWWLSHPLTVALMLYQ